eukprot:3841968-Prymnesium_polylepis.1
MEFMLERLETAHQHVEGKREFLASSVVEAEDTERDLGERCEVATYMEAYVVGELDMAKAAFAKVRAEHEEVKASMRGRLTKLGAGKRRASSCVIETSSSAAVAAVASSFSTEGEVDPSKLDPVMAAAYMQAM